MARFGNIINPSSRLGGDLKTYPVKSITIRSNWNKNEGGLGRPLNCSLFTFNRNSRRFEPWGSRDSSYSSQNLMVGEGDNDFIGPLPAQGDVDGPPLISRDTLQEILDEGSGWPDWMPDGCRIIQSGFKGDGLALGGNPQGGALGLRGNPVLLEANFDIGESSGGLSLGLQCDLDPGGSPYDVGVMLAYHHYWPVGQRCVVGAGAGLFLQATSDSEAGGQEGDWTGDHHPYPFIEIKLEHAIDGLHADGGLYFDVRVALDTERMEPFFGFGLGWSPPNP